MSCCKKSKYSLSNYVFCINNKITTIIITTKSWGGLTKFWVNFDGEASHSAEGQYFLCGSEGRLELYLITTVQIHWHECLFFRVPAALQGEATDQQATSGQAGNRCSRHEVKNDQGGEGQRKRKNQGGKKWVWVYIMGIGYWVLGIGYYYTLLSTSAILSVKCSPMRSFPKY